MGDSVSYLAFFLGCTHKPVRPLTRSSAPWGGGGVIFTSKFTHKVCQSKTIQHSSPNFSLLRWLITVSLFFDPNSLMDRCYHTFSFASFKLNSIEQMPNYITIAQQVVIIFPT